MRDDDSKSIRPVMLPPLGFIESAVERGLAEVRAEEALCDTESLVADSAERGDPVNDVAPLRSRRRRDSGIISGISIDDTPTLPFIRVANHE